MGMRKIGSIVCTILLLTGSLYANQSSLECTKVKRGSCEALVCNSDELMDLNIALIIAYNEAKVKTSKIDMLKANQKDWEKNRNECWKVQDVDGYLIDIYHTRIKELKKQSLLSNT